MFILGFPAGGVKALVGGDSGSGLGVRDDTPAPPPPPPPPPSDDVVIPWDVKLRDFLHFICAVIHCEQGAATPESLLAADLAGAPITASDAEVAAFIGAFRAHGVDGNLGPTQRGQYRSAALALADHAAADPGVLNPNQREELIEVANQIADRLSN